MVGLIFLSFAVQCAAAFLPSSTISTTKSSCGIQFRPNNDPALPSLWLSIPYIHPLSSIDDMLKDHGGKTRVLTRLDNSVKNTASCHLYNHKIGFKLQVLKQGIRKVSRMLKRFLVVAFVVIALTLSPAEAKGGGGRSSFSGGSYTRPPISSSSYSRSSPSPSPSSTRTGQKLSRGRVGGRVKRGTRTSSKQTQKSSESASQNPVYKKSSPSSTKREETKVSTSRASSEPARSQGQQIQPSSSSFQPRQQVIIVGKQAEPVPTGRTRGPPAAKGTTGNLAKHNIYNPWPDRIWGAGVGAGVGTYFTGGYLSEENAKKLEARVAEEIYKRNLVDSHVLEERLAQEISQRIKEDLNKLKQPPGIVDQVMQTILSVSSLLDGNQDRSSSLTTTTTQQSILNQFDPVRDSGTYRGATEESDGTSQEVESKLQFMDDGKIKGSGFDQEDGPYTINGTWSGHEATWKEQYGNYYVQVQCTRRQQQAAFGDDNKTTLLHCNFVSSMDNITGKFYLQKKD